MAIIGINLKPKFSACGSRNCEEFKIVKTTGLYSLTNTGGWNDSVNSNEATYKSNVTRATISYKLSNQSTYTVLDVTNTVLNSGFFTETFDLVTINEDIPDGEISIIYTVITNPNGEGEIVHITEGDIYSLCKVQCCVDKLWFKAVDECNCGCDNNMEKAIKAQALLTAIKNMSSCGNEETKDKLLIKLQRLCKIEKCNCNH